MTEEKMLSRTQDSVGYIIFNNPEKHNAVSIEMWDALEKFLNQFREDNNIRVVVLEGAGGKSFVSGADISKFDKERSKSNWGRSCRFRSCLATSKFWCTSQTS